MCSIFAVADSIISPLGSSSEENFLQVSRNITGIRCHDDPSRSQQPFYASLLEPADVALEPFDPAIYLPFERLVMASVKDALKTKKVDPVDPRTIFILSTTKGGISLVETQPIHLAEARRIALHQSARAIADYFGFFHKPIVVSHACISGLLAIITAKRLIESGRYDHAVVAGGDMITRFVLSGFQSFQAVSASPCKPFDADRDGISLGEAAATIILTRDPAFSSCPRICGGSVSNDANHISGPSRTGEELGVAIRRAMNQSGLDPGDIDFISAHGTATLYNDEMEAKAITLTGLQDVPVNSLKGYYGHTLGAAGLLETIISIHSLKAQLFLPTMGFSRHGTSKPIKVSNTTLEGKFRNFLKTASGFGGCNAAMVVQQS